MRQRFASGTCLFKSLITQMIFEDVSLAKESNHMEGTKNKLKGPFLLSALSLQGTLPSTGECVASSIFKTICVLFFFLNIFMLKYLKISAAQALRLHLWQAQLCPMRTPQMALWGRCHPYLCLTGKDIPPVCPCLWLHDTWYGC